MSELVKEVETTFKAKKLLGLPRTVMGAIYFQYRHKQVLNQLLESAALARADAEEIRAHPELYRQDPIPNPPRRRPR
ncbi:unnamed protein product [Cochlearia groenlandica]